MEDTGFFFPTQQNRAIPFSEEQIMGEGHGQIRDDSRLLASKRLVFPTAPFPPYVVKSQNTPAVEMP